MGYKHVCDRCGAELLGEKYISILIEKPEDRNNGPSFYNSTKKDFCYKCYKEITKVIYTLHE